MEICTSTSLQCPVLPLELWDHILWVSKSSDLLRLSRVNKFFHSIISHPGFLVRFLFRKEQTTFAGRYTAQGSKFLGYRKGIQVLFSKSKRFFCWVAVNDHGDRYLHILDLFKSLYKQTKIANNNNLTSNPSSVNRQLAHVLSGGKFRGVPKKMRDVCFSNIFAGEIASWQRGLPLQVIDLNTDKVIQKCEFPVDELRSRPLFVCLYLSRCHILIQSSFNEEGNLAYSYHLISRDGSGQIQTIFADRVWGLAIIMSDTYVAIYNERIKQQPSYDIYLTHSFNQPPFSVKSDDPKYPQLYFDGDKALMLNRTGGVNLFPLEDHKEPISCFGNSYTYVATDRGFCACITDEGHFDLYDLELLDETQESNPLPWKSHQLEFNGAKPIGLHFEMKDIAHLLLLVQLDNGQVVVHSSIDPYSKQGIFRRLKQKFVQKSSGTAIPK